MGEVEDESVALCTPCLPVLLRMSSNKRVDSFLNSKKTCLTSLIFFIVNAINGARYRKNAFQHNDVK